LHLQLKSLKNNKDSQKLFEFIENLKFLGIFDKKFIKNKLTKSDLNVENFNQENIVLKNNGKIDINFIENQIALRYKYKSEKNFAQADEIRLKLSEMGVAIEDKSNGITIFTIK